MADGADICLTCHLGTRKTYARAASVHPPFADGPCTDCHDPHGSAQPRLLRLPHRELCLDCHDDLKKTLEAPGVKVHDPVRQGCLDCHQGHGSAAEKLLRQPVPALCAECHTPSATAPVEGHPPVPDGAGCLECHPAHAPGPAVTPAAKR